MTTDVQIPYVDLKADGQITRFHYTFSIVEDLDLLVLVNQILQTQYSSYTLENVTDDGGDIVFRVAPLAGSDVLILRQTTVSQNVDYTENNPFPAETHEWNLDKITFILQEMVNGAYGGVDEDGNPIYLSFNLSVTPEESKLTINNTGGTDAVLQPWVSGQKAGVFHGEIGAVPPDESATTKPDGYVWLQVT